jgi:hypothetical protein
MVALRLQGIFVNNNLKSLYFLRSITIWYPSVQASTIPACHSRCTENPTRDRNHSVPVIGVETG